MLAVYRKITARLPRIVLPRSTFLIACTLAVLGFLLVQLAGPAPLVGLDHAADFEGQGDVRLEGIVQAPSNAADGSARFLLAAAGQSINVRSDGSIVVRQGAWVQATGRIARNAGELTLWTTPQAIRAQSPSGVENPSWKQLAEEPADWVGIPIHIAGIVQQGSLRDKDGHSLSIEPGAWPAGPADVLGYLAYKPACVCYRLAPMAA